MKRTIKDYRLKRVKEVYPRFFWKRCFRCEQEVKKEPMFRFSIPWYETNLNYFLCKSCCPSKDYALKVYDHLSEDKLNPKDVFKGLP